MVFGVTTPPPARDPLPFTLIFEYGLPIGDGSQTRNFWAKSWHSLGSIGGPGSFSTDYGNSLQLLIQMFTSRGMGGALRVGRSALNQLRSNELALGPTWELREWRWDSETQTLKPATTVNNPHDSCDSARAQELADWLMENRSQVLAGTHMIPRKFLGATSPAVGDSWRLNGLLAKDQELRKAFAVNTCNGCHTSETNTFFTHVGTRAAKKPAELSDFLSR